MNGAKTSSGFNAIAIRILILAAVVVVGVPAAKHFVDYVAVAGDGLPYGWQDEGHALESTMSVYKNGYKGYRCRENNPSACYGSTQAFSDAFILKRLGAKRVEEGKLRPNPGAKWFFMSEYPDALRYLRLVRVAYAAMLCLALMWLARRSGMTKGMAWVAGLGVVCFGAFWGSRQGLKNDFPAALVLLAFMCFASLALRDARKGKGLFWLVLAMLAGVAGIGFKFGTIPGVALLVPAFLAASWSGSRSFARAFKQCLIACVLAAAAYAAMNPNILYSSSEAAWFMVFTAVSSKNTDAARARIELFTFLIPNVWPLALVALFWVRECFTKGITHALLRWGYFLVVPALITFLNYRSAWLRPPYYLPVLVWSLAVLFMMWRENGGKLARAGQLVLLAGIVGTRFWDVNNSWDIAGAISGAGGPRHGEPLYGLLSKDQAASSKLWLLDLALRPAIREDALAASNIVFFDSLSEPPATALGRARAKWKDRPEAAKMDFNVVSACWKGFSPSVHSPAAELWALAMAAFCAGRAEELGQKAVYAFENGWRPAVYAVAKASELAAPAARAAYPAFAARRLNPRMMSGAIAGVDYWFSPLVMARPGVLEASYRWKYGMKGVRLKVESTCKGRGTMKIEILSMPQGMGPGRLEGAHGVSLDVKEQFCADKKILCMLGLENWWTRRAAVAPVEVKGAVHPGAPAMLRITLEGLDSRTCRVAFQEIELL
ncbi:MAG: hypothetical protein A2583_05670 [Bdellovibrionales bacterium RIFOXYD1_FULL_53_11]|nr:MAG: hypothetical protein A2583_05670 [Bdellovibrionales bacterium RIFOXYD1_FULL_53_11]